MAVRPRPAQPRSPHSAPLQQNILSDGRVYVGDSAIRAQSPPRARGVFDNLPASMAPVSPSKAKKPPATMDEFSDQLRSWIRGNATLMTESAKYAAWSEYVAEAVKYAHDVGVEGALKYHLQSMKAAQATPVPRYDALRDGMRFAEAYFDCIQPLQLARTAHKAAPRGSPRRPTRKRGAPDAAAASSPSPVAGQTPQAGALVCTVHGLGGHTTADCRTLKRPKPAAARPN